MAKRTIVSMPGDEIGRVVIEETILVLGAAGYNANFMTFLPFKERLIVK